MEHIEVLPLLLHGGKVQLGLRATQEVSRLLLVIVPLSSANSEAAVTVKGNHGPSLAVGVLVLDLLDAVVCNAISALLHLEGASSMLLTLMQQHAVVLATKMVL